MSSVVLRTSVRLLISLLLLYSVFLLLRGHNLPGGGFIGGLVASSAWALYAISFGVKNVKHVLWWNPNLAIAFGLSVAMLSGVLGLLKEAVWLKGLWLYWQPGQIALLTVGTPLLFDVGVYFVVLGTIVSVVMALLED